VCTQSPFIVMLVACLPDGSILHLDWLNANSRSEHEGQGVPCISMLPYDEMNNNPPIRTPPTIAGRVTAVLTMLGLPPTDDYRRHQVESFIKCNGYQGVLRAVNFTVERAAHTSIHNPWRYTIDAYNGNLARLSYLYLLVHWIESGLRSQLDLYYTFPNGPTRQAESQWHRSPRLYLPRDSVTNFLSEHGHLGIVVDYPKPSSPEIVRPEQSADFLERVTFGWLITMVTYAHGRKATAIIVDPDKHLIPSEAKSKLEGIRKIRNTVAHNQYINNKQFESYQEQLLYFLKVLRFDVVKALERSEEERTKLVQANLLALKSNP